MSWKSRVIVGACAALVACSSSNGSGSSSTPAPSQALGSLSSSEKAGLCDSLAQTAGGYGHGVVCAEEAGTATNTFWSDQTECTQGLALVPTTCEATVAQYTACVQWALSCASVDMPYPTNCDPLFESSCKPTNLGVGTSTSATSTDAGN